MTNKSKENGETLRAHTIFKGISLKMDAIVQLEIELTYFEALCI